MYTLRQLVGKRSVQGGIQTVEQPIDEVLKEDSSRTNGVRRLGFISRHPGAHISFRAGLSDGEKHEALVAVTKLRKERNLETAEVAVSTPMLPTEDIEGEESETDDE